MDRNSIRLASPVDEPAVAACVRAAYAGYVDLIGRPPAPMEADYGVLIARRVVHVLVDEGRVRGVVVMLPREDHLFLENIAVHPGDQGRGRGRRLMAFVEQYARQHRLPEIRLYTNEVMTQNLAFYTRLGFVEVERRLEDGFRRIFMRKTLR